MITTFGEIMLRITPNDSGERILQTNNFRIEPGGSESNVAIALANLGHETQLATKLPDNELTQKIQHYLNTHKVKPVFALGGDRAGMYWTETGIGPRNSFVIYDRDYSAFSQATYEDFDWKTILQNSQWFHFSGISPALSETVYNFLKQVVDECTCPYSVDLNYRKKLWNWLDKDVSKINEVMTKLCHKATLIAGNEADFTDIFGIQSDEKDVDEKYQQIAEKAFNKFPNAKFISISHRQSISATKNDWSGYLFVHPEGKVNQFKGLSYSIDHIIDRVGTGDSFVAGIIHGILSFEKDYQKTVNFATTLAALNHTTKGDASTFNVEDVMKTIQSNGSGRIVR
ncbi:MAG: PfkB family carbohydrate kinase [bacterium]